MSIKVIDSQSPLYKLPFGCGTIAIANALNIMQNKQISNELLTKIAKAIKEEDRVTYSDDLTKGLKSLKIKNKVTSDITLMEIKSHLKSKKPLIFLHFNKNNINTGIGHYSIVHGSDSMAYDGNDLLCDIDIIHRLSIKNDEHKPLIWFLF